MVMTCRKCCQELRPGASYCGQCGCSVVHEIQPVQAYPVHDLAPPPMHPPIIHAPHDELAVKVKLEVMTRLNPLMNQERMKTMVMAIAAHGGTGTVGFWSDD